MRSKSIYDAESSVLLRAQGSAAITATTNGTAVAHDVTGQAYNCAIHVAAVDRGNSDETYVATVQVDTNSAFGSPVTVATLPSITETGIYNLLFDGETAQLFEDGASHVRIVMTLGGTSPSITFASYLAPIYI